MHIRKRKPKKFIRKRRDKFKKMEEKRNWQTDNLTVVQFDELKKSRHWVILFDDERCECCESHFRKDIHTGEICCSFVCCKRFFD